jgi:hypothetical protein
MSTCSGEEGTYKAECDTATALHSKVLREVLPAADCIGLHLHRLVYLYLPRYRLHVEDTVLLLPAIWCQDDL